MSDPQFSEVLGDAATEREIERGCETARELSALRAKLQQAEAACAEMRKAMANGPLEDHSNDPWCRCAWCHALSTTCGQGWLSPEKARVLTEALETAQSKLDRYAIEHPTICYQCAKEVREP